MRISSRTSIPDPYSDVPTRDRQCHSLYVTSTDYNYLLINVLGRTPGALNAILNTLLSSFINELRTTLPAGPWQPENERIVLELLARLNFKPAPAPRKRKSPAAGSNAS